MKSEKWKPVNGYEKYYKVSNLGRVKRLIPDGRSAPDGMLNPAINYSGYLRVCLYVNGINKNKSIHRLVAQAFIPNENNYPQINHVDGCKENNNVDNLEWCTGSQNFLHSFKTGLNKPTLGESHYKAKLKDKDIIEIRRLRKSGIYQRTIAKMFNVSQSLIAHIDNGDRWKHIA